MFVRIAVLLFLYSWIPAGNTASKSNAPDYKSQYEFDERLLERMVKISYEFEVLAKKVHLKSDQMEKEINDINEKLEFIMKRNTKPRKAVATCPDEWVVYGTSCYFISRTQMTFAASEEFCTEKGGTLVHIETEDENKFVQKELQKSKGDKFWIGITDEEQEGYWVFSGTSVETAVPYLYWGTNQPNNYRVSNCGAIWRSFGYKWVDEPCTNSFQPVCERHFNTV